MAKLNQKEIHIICMCGQTIKPRELSKHLGSQEHKTAMEKRSHATKRTQPRTRKAA